VKRKWKFECESETIIISSDASNKPQSRLRRVLGFAGSTVFIILLSVLPAAAVALGIHGLLVGKMPVKHGATLHGDMAISCSWRFIAIGSLWFGWILEELTGRPPVQVAFAGCCRWDVHHCVGLFRPICLSGLTRIGKGIRQIVKRSRSEFDFSLARLLNSND
jgi:hypothetical protein